MQTTSYHRFHACTGLIPRPSPSGLGMRTTGHIRDCNLTALLLLTTLGSNCKFRDVRYLLSTDTNHKIMLISKRLQCIVIFIFYPQAKYFTFRANDLIYMWVNLFQNWPRVCVSYSQTHTKGKNSRVNTISHFHLDCQDLCAPIRLLYQSDCIDNVRWDYITY